MNLVNWKSYITKKYQLDSALSSSLHMFYIWMKSIKIQISPLKMIITKQIMIQA